MVADNIAPEDILFTPTARDQDKASFLGFRKRVTASDLVEMGLDQDEVDELRSDRDLSFEETQRNDSAILNEAERDVVFFAMGQLSARDESRRREAILEKRGRRQQRDSGARQLIADGCENRFSVAPLQSRQD